MGSAHPKSDQIISAEEFEGVKQRFRALGDRLTDEQLLQLADAYHDILRWRREVRCRHPAVAAPRVSFPSEPTSFEPYRTL